MLAIASTAVNPPRAAASVPDCTVSASSRPGSRKWVCRSTRPGNATSPSASSSFSVGSRVGRIHEPAVPDQQVGAPTADEVGTADQQVGHSAPPSSSYSTLIRTDTPAATWSKIKELAASAASAEISKPRFIGPGWQIAAPGFIASSLGRVRP